ncbi:MAG: DUF2089 domain-containing protein [Bacillota bacterium]
MHKEVADTDKYKAPSTCPVCGGQYEITALTCKQCKSELNGRFEGCEFCSLNESEKGFLSAFIKCRGNIKEVEKELGISYPTVRNRLDNIISRLGYEDKQAGLVKEERQKIIKQLENGEISAGEAAEILKSLK